MTNQKTDLQNLITQKQRCLLKRKDQQARMGINTPPEILTEIEDITEEIANLPN